MKMWAAKELDTLLGKEEEGRGAMLRTPRLLTSKSTIFP